MGKQSKSKKFRREIRSYLRSDAGRRDRLVLYGVPPQVAYDPRNDDTRVDLALAEIEGNIR